eukprot:CAMPEP_0113686136 /NCGR_PEP_ID=MMETSP0038_2-20120614/15110_1 /TAXON_ID=2898 /ORGANISM="Cryptomonas paramecium" /LENGTH=155 /DNA_ID=CAMNT_0000606401 /DNA_START=60 /DNA_END=527 /DNA_ORIENTATION=+ /assembly_acc=CAM_ASM_000170
MEDLLAFAQAQPPNNPAWHRQLPTEWCGFLMKKSRGPLPMWSRRLFELRRPALGPNSTYPVLVYLSSSLKTDVVLRVKGVKHSVDGQHLRLELEVIEASLEGVEGVGESRRMLLLVPDEARESHFHTKLLLLAEAGRRYRGDATSGGTESSGDLT